MILEKTQNSEKKIRKLSKDKKIGSIIAKFLIYIIKNPEDVVKGTMKPCTSPYSLMYHKHLTKRLIILTSFEGERCIVNDIGHWEEFFGNKNRFLKI